MARKPEPPKPPESARELIVMVRPDAGMRASRSRVESVTGQKTTSIRDILKDNKAVMMPLFGPNEERVITRTRSEAETAEMPLEDLSVFYRVEADEERLDEIGGKLFEQELVEAAYVKPASSPPVGPPVASPCAGRSGCRSGGSGGDGAVGNLHRWRR